MAQAGFGGPVLRLGARICRPWIWHELPGWGRLVRLLRLDGVDNRNPVWAGSRPVRLRGKLHGQLLELELSNDLDRMVWLLGRYYDLPVQLAAQAILRPGDICADIGANVGHFAALAAALVGPGGRVLAVEPNPRCLARLERMRAANGLAQVESFGCALGAAPGRAVLHLLGGDTILGTLAAGAADHPAHREAIEVAVEVTDALLGPRLGDGALVKMDVEGFEMEVLRGFASTIAACRPLFILEMSEANLARAGSGCAEVAAFLRARDYGAWRLGSRRQGLTGNRLTLDPVPGPGWPAGAPDADVLWLPAGQERFDPAAFAARP